MHGASPVGFVAHPENLHATDKQYGRGGEPMPPAPPAASASCRLYYHYVVVMRGRRGVVFDGLVSDADQRVRHGLATTAVDIVVDILERTCGIDCLTVADPPHHLVAIAALVR